jgi:hypothetical protein
MPVENNRALSADGEEVKPLSQSQLDLVISRVENSFVRLISNDGKVKQGWGVLYDGGESLISGLLVRSLDIYRFNKTFADLSAISSNKSMVVMSPDDWTFESQSRKGFPYGYLHDFSLPYEGSVSELQSMQFVNIDYLNDFQIPYKGSISGTLIYPAKDGKINRASISFTATKPEDENAPAGHFSYNMPNDYDSGIGIVVRADGKLLPFALETSDRSEFISFDVNTYHLSKFTIRSLRGNPRLVAPLANIDNLYVLVDSKDEVEPISDSELKSYVTSFLNEECPRLTISKGPVIKGANFVSEPRSSTERNALLQLFDAYQPWIAPMLFVTYRRSSNGLFIVELEVSHSVLGNGGSTTATMYKDYIYGINTERTDIVRDRVKKLIKKFSDQWIVANPREKG